MNAMIDLKSPLGQTSLHTRQGGGVLILFGVSVLVLFGFMALVIDLGRTYVVRTELQNAADAAALAGAKELNQTFAGVGSAVARAKAIAAQNNYLFSTPVPLLDADIFVGNCPDDECMVLASLVASDADAASKTFIKVSMSSGNLATFFARIPTTFTGVGRTSTSTFGLAVAGRYINDLTPIGICAIKDAAGLSRPKGEKLPVTGELAQYGFRRGVSYNIFELNPLAPGDPYLINPLDKYPSPCDPGNSSADATAPFICSGVSAVLPVASGTVYGNTGVSAGKIQAALNSRFDFFSGPSVCIPAEAPPDSNVKKFAGCTGGGSCASDKADWMGPNPAPAVQTMSNPSTPVAPATVTSIPSADKYGVLWSYSRAVRAVGDTPDATPGANFTPSDWEILYLTANGTLPATNTNFPSSGSPYFDSGHTVAPTSNPPGRENRRLLNLAIIDCPNTGGSGSCKTLPVLAIGRFFMQVPADFNGSPKKLEVEFAGLIDPVPVSDIKLYR